MSEQNQYEVSADKWSTRAGIASRNERRSEGMACMKISRIFDDRSMADRRAAEAAKRIATDASWDAVEAAMKARATMVATNTAIALIEHLEDDHTPIEIVDALQEQTVSFLVQRSTNGSQSTSTIATAQAGFEVAATVDVARIVGVR